MEELSSYIGLKGNITLTNISLMSLKTYRP